MPHLRRLLPLALTVCLSCGALPNALPHRVYVRHAAATERRSTPQLARHPSVAALNHDQRLAFRRWVLALYFASWIAAGDANATLACGGDLPPCYVMWRESKGNPYAVNPGHAGAPYGDPGDPSSHASGKWQFMPSTWNGYAGYPYAAAAPAAVQNAKAREVWAGGAGASHWACC